MVAKIPIVNVLASGISAQTKSTPLSRSAKINETFLLSRSSLATNKVCLLFLANLIASSMFLTGTASNPMCQKFALNLGIKITWMSWAAAAIVPGLCAVFVIPFVLYKIYPPELKKTGA